MSANERQVGGEHYKRAVQHWDLCALANAGYFAGQVTKYTERHAKKNGREDLEKALHFAEKMHEVAVKPFKTPQFRRGFLGRKVRVEQPAPAPDSPALVKAVRDYAIVADLSALQERIFELCLIRPDQTEEIVGLCRMHLNRKYGSPVTPTSTAPIPATFVGELSPAQETMKQDMLQHYEEDHPSPEDGGHHEVQESQEQEQSSYEVDVDPKLVAALEAQMAVEQPEPVIHSDPPRKRK